MKKFLMIIVSSLLSLSLSGLPVYANTPDNDKASSTTEIYVDENYGNQTSESITPRNRGNCTDVYSRAWCNAHGYQNNRPVGGTVILNKDERRCYFGLISSGLHTEITLLVYGAQAGALIAVPFIAFELFNCLF